MKINRLLFCPEGDSDRQIPTIPEPAILFHPVLCQLLRSAALGMASTHRQAARVSDIGGGDCGYKI